jgi:hypothetical protein
MLIRVGPFALRPGRVRKTSYWNALLLAPRHRAVRHGRASGTWDLYPNGVKIVNVWTAHTGTTPVGRVYIGNTHAYGDESTFTSRGPG